MNPLTPYLLWIKLGAIAALIAGGFWYRHHVDQGGYDRAVAERAARDAAAVANRAQENSVLSVKQDATNVIITKAKNEELAPVRTRVATERVRVGPSLCNGLAAITEAKSPTSGDGPDSSARLVQPRIEADIRKLILDVEEDLATGRACQAFVRENGLVP